MNRRGFTVLEVLVAILIFALGALVLMKMQVTTVKSGGFNKQATVAISLAQKKMEELKSLAYTSVASNTTGVTDQIAGITYTTKWTVNESGSSPARYKTVGVTVTWPTGGITIDSIISEV